jgi:glutamine synthetase
MGVKEALDLAKRHGAVAADFRFCDFLGTWQHCSFPMSEIDEGVFADGLGFDGSSIRGWQAIHESDMLMVPDASTAFIDPFFAHPTIVFLCDIRDPVSGQPYSRDPRNIAKKAEAFLKQSGVGDTAYFGPEAEFFVFGHARFGSGPDHALYQLDSVEAAWNSGAEEGGRNLAYKLRHKQGYYPVPPNDTLQDARAEMVLAMEGMGIRIEAHHHEVATAGQCEIDMRFDTLVGMADKLMKYKYVVRQVARKRGLVATFMPKPIFGDNGSGMHTHQSVWKGGKPLFAGDGYAGLSDLGLHYIGGVLKHSRALAAFTNPGTNSYKRLTPGFEAPVNLALSARNRSASCRIPLYSASPAAKRVEVRYPDPTCNPYLAFAAMLMAGIDGVTRRTSPGDPLDHDLYELSPEALAKIPTMPASLDEALAELQADHGFLLQGGVFTQDVIDTQIAYKRKHEIDALRLRPHPHEFELYFDA